MRKTLEQRFWAKVSNRGGEGCWEWTGSRNACGYGNLNNKWASSTLSHRICWTLVNGDIPVHTCVLHRCDNPPCCNPDHLFLGSHDANMKDMKVKNRRKGIVAVSGETCGASKLTQKDVIAIRYARVMFGVSYSMLGKAIGVSGSQARRICIEECWRQQVTSGR